MSWTMRHNVPTTRIRSQNKTVATEELRIYMSSTQQMHDYREIKSNTTSETLFTTNNNIIT